MEVGCAGKSTQLHEGQSYPYTADLLNPIEVMVYREGPTVELVNHTVHSYKDFNLWINERYVRQIPRLEAGASISVSLHEFSDEHGEAFRAGGLLSTRKPEPLTKAEIETDEGLIGLLVVRLDRP
ncbi:MAG: hypothetical protein D8M59_02905 [Planctomycetes bacterium]|nr:hypothetical protein [Planctomycetota bacterium]